MRITSPYADGATYRGGRAGHPQGIDTIRRYVEGVFTLTKPCRRPRVVVGGCGSESRARHVRLPRGRGGSVDEVIGALLRAVLWLIRQVVKSVAEMIVGELAEKIVRAVKRRVVTWRSRRRRPPVAPPSRVSLEKETPTV